MDLLRQIRTGRADRRTKAPFRRGLYTRISGLVRRYRLGEPFLRRLETCGGPPREDAPAGPGRKRKEPYDAPLFSLSTEHEHRVTLAILARVKSPYLWYATSPDEILVCDSLFRQDPSLGPETLLCHHFETLLSAGEGTRPK